MCGSLECPHFVEGRASLLASGISGANAATSLISRSCMPDGDHFPTVSYPGIKGLPYGCTESDNVCWINWSGNETTLWLTSIFSVVKF